MMNEILSNLPEKYKNIVQNLEDKLYDNIYMLTEKGPDNISANYDRMNTQFNQKRGK